eukprot:298302_1
MSTDISYYEACGLTNAPNCAYNADNINNGTELTYDEDVYCCNYVLGRDSNSLSQQQLFDQITLVKNLNIISLISDYAFVIIAVCVLTMTYFNGKDLKRAKTVTLIITTIGSLIDIGLTFSIVAIIDQNGLIDILFHLYSSVCYSENIELTLLDLHNQFETVLVLDAVEGSLDIISLIVLCIGISFCRDSSLQSMSEGIHGFMFMIFDLILITVNVFIYVLPSYNTFVKSYDNENEICFQKISKKITPKPTQSPTTDPTTAKPTTIGPSKSPTQPTATPTTPQPRRNNPYTLECSGAVVSREWIGGFFDSKETVIGGIPPDVCARFKTIKDEDGGEVDSYKQLKCIGNDVYVYDYNKTNEHCVGNDYTSYLLSSHPNYQTSDSNFISSNSFCGLPECKFIIHNLGNYDNCFFDITEHIDGQGNDYEIKTSFEDRENVVIDGQCELRDTGSTKWECDNTTLTYSVYYDNFDCSGVPDVRSYNFGDSCPNTANTIKGVCGVAPYNGTQVSVGNINCVNGLTCLLLCLIYLFR